MKERNEIDPALFSTGANILEKSNNGTKYQIECDTPNGTMQCIHLFPGICLLYTSDAADDLLCVDLGGRRTIKKKNR